MKFLYISTVDKYPPDKHIVDGLRETGHDVFELIKKNSTYIDFIRDFRNNESLCDYIIIGYALPLLMPIARIFSLKKYSSTPFRRNMKQTLFQEALESRGH